MGSFENESLARQENELSKINGYKWNIFSSAGKEVPIKVIIQAIPAYIMSIIKHPKLMCKDLATEAINFFVE